MIRRRFPRHPVFDIVLVDEGRSLTWLARNTEYSHSHVKAVAAGIQPAGARFRAACVRVMGRPENELFHGGNGSTESRPAGTPSNGSSNRAETAGEPAAYHAQEVVVLNRTA